jgi:N-acetylmuramoyl-L-alanine amidase
MLLACAITAHAETARFTATVNGVERQAVVDSVTVDDREYVPVLSIARQLGGDGRLVGTRVQLDLGGHSAFAAIDDREVNASAARFDLEAPLKRGEVGPLIALSEVTTFFQQGFEVAVTAREAPAPENPATDLEDPSAMMEPLGEEDLLEPVSVPESTPAPAAQSINMTIAVDAGHGGGDVGIVGPGGTEEKAVTLAVAQAIQSALASDAGFEVTLTRTEDKARSFSQRRGAIKEGGAELVVSIHASGSPSQQANGISIFYAPDTGSMGDSVADRLMAARTSGNAAISKVVAEAVYRTLSSDTQRPVHMPREIPLRLMSASAAPGVLIEVGYLSNPVEERLLMDSNEQSRIARAVASGVRSAMTQLQEGTVQ